VIVRPRRRIVEIEGNVGGKKGKRKISRHLSGAEGKATNRNKEKVKAHRPIAGGRVERFSRSQGQQQLSDHKPPPWTLCVDQEEGILEGEE